jgi:hypothetical protein
MGTVVEAITGVGIKFDKEAITIWVVDSSPTRTIHGADGITYHTTDDSHVTEFIFPNFDALRELAGPYGFSLSDYVRNVMEGERVEEYVEVTVPYDLEEVYGG